MLLKCIFSKQITNSNIPNRSVQFNEEVEVKTLVEGIGSLNTAPAEVVEISEDRIDYVMSLLHEADPVSVS